MKKSIQLMGFIFPLLSLVAVAQTGEESADSNLEEVRVYGQKIERSLQDTKESVAILGAEDIETRGIIDFKDVLAQTAGVSSSGTGVTFSIRGIDSGQIGTSRGELASFYVDDVALSGWVKAEGPQQMWDVEQVEVFRGPQSTNFGRNSLAGAILVRTATPAYENEGKVRLGFGSYGTQEFSATGNVVIQEGVSALRITVDHRETDGSINNVTRGEDDIAFEERQTIRAKWLYEPSDDLRIVASLQNVKNDYGDNSQAFEGSGYDREDRVSLADVRGAYPIDANIASVVIDYNLNASWSLKSVTAGMKGERTRADDFDDSARDGGMVYREGDDKNISQELRFNYDADTWRGSTGVYYSNEKADNFNDTNIVLDLQQNINDLSGGLGDLLVGVGAYPQFYEFFTGGFNNNELTNYAVFTEWEASVDDQWTLSFGVRYDQNNQNFEYNGVSFSDVALPEPEDFRPTLTFLIGDDAGNASADAMYQINFLLGSLTDPVDLASLEASYDAILPHAGATYHWTPDISSSFFVKQGYRAGGAEITGLGLENEFDPEYLTTYEFAHRSVFAGGRGLLNANLYYGDWKDQQVSLPEVANSGVFFIVENAGESEIYGLEMELNYQVSDSLSTYTTAAISKTEYKEFITNTEDLSGNEFRFAPGLTGALGINYLAESGLFINANLTYQGSSYSDDSNDLELDSRVIANLYVGYDLDEWRFEAYSTNLFDEQYSLLIFGSEIDGDIEWGRMGDPREFGLRASYRF